MLAAISWRQRLKPEHMINVRMGQPDPPDGETPRLHRRENLRVPFPCIYQHRVTRDGIPDHPAVLDERAGGDAEDLGALLVHSLPWCANQRSASSAAIQPVPAEVMA